MSECVEKKTLINGLEEFIKNTPRKYIRPQDLLMILKNNKFESFIPLNKLCELFYRTSVSIPCSLCEEVMPKWCNQMNGDSNSWTWDTEVKCPSWKELLTQWLKNN